MIQFDYFNRVETTNELLFSPCTLGKMNAWLTSIGSQLGGVQISGAVLSVFMRVFPALNCNKVGVVRTNQLHEHSVPTN